MKVKQSEIERRAQAKVNEVTKKYVEAQNRQEEAEADAARMLDEWQDAMRQLKEAGLSKAEENK